MAAMNEDHPILEYAPRPVAYGQLRLEERPGVTRVVFGVPPRWVYWLQIIYPVALGLMFLAMGFMAGRMIWEIAGSMPAPTNPAAAKEWQETRDASRRAAVRVVAYPSIVARMATPIAGYLWVMYRRWGRVPRTLTATDEGLVLSCLGWWRIRERNWPKDEIESVQLRLAKGNLIPKRTVGDLYIKRGGGRPLHFRLGSRDPELPVQIARRLARRLGCPCE